jgi:putative pyruvate formate lyase activating enzyme
MGAHNINLVNPTHFVPQILNALAIAGDRLHIPIVYNSSGYEKTETLKLLSGHIDIFLPDLKYFDQTISKKYSSAENYFEYAISAIRTMADIVGKPVIENGIMKKGVIVRHMVMPNHRHDSIRLIDELSRRFEKDEIMVSLMRQYTPVFRAAEFPEINRKLSTFEYKSVAQELEKSGFDGYLQEKSAANEEFIPQFYGRKYF